MSVCPRILFTRFEGFETVKAGLWRDHLTRVTSQAIEVRPSDPVDAPIVAWSLVSANNRELARGFGVYAWFEDAVADVRRVIATREQLEPRLVNDRRLGGFGWYLSSDDLPEVVCGRWYESDRDRRAGLGSARAALGVAEIMPGVRAMPILHPAGAS